MGHWEAVQCQEKGFDCSLENLWLMAQKNGVVMLNKKKKRKETRNSLSSLNNKTAIASESIVNTSVFSHQNIPTHASFLWRWQFVVLEIIWTHAFLKFNVCNFINSVPVGY